MRAILGIVVGLFLSIGPVGLTPCTGQPISTFDAGDEGWTVIGDGNGPSFYSSGGNPGGYVSVTDRGEGIHWYWKAPGKFHGDFSAYYNGSLSFDQRQTPLSLQVNDVDVYLVGGGLTLVFDTANNPSNTWTSYEIPLLENAGWKKDSLSGVSPTKAELQQVLGSVTDLRIRGEFSHDYDVGDLDNVVFVPEPAALSLLAVGGLAMLRRRRGE